MESASDTTVHQRWANKNLRWNLAVCSYITTKYNTSWLLLQAAYPLGELVLGSPTEGYWVDEITPDGIECTTSTFMLHVPERARGGYPLQAPDVASKKQWISVLTDVIESTRATPEVVTYLPYSYDNDVDTLRRDGSHSSDSADPMVIVSHRDSTASSQSNWIA